MKIKLPDILSFLEPKDRERLFLKINIFLDDQKKANEECSDYIHYITDVGVNQNWTELVIYLPDACRIIMRDSPELWSAFIKNSQLSAVGRAWTCSFQEGFAPIYIHRHFGSFTEKEILKLINNFQKSLNYVFENRLKIQEEIKVEEEKKKQLESKRRGLL